MNELVDEIEIMKNNLQLFATKINKRAIQHNDNNLKNSYEALCETIMYLELCLRNKKTN